MDVTFRHPNGAKVTAPAVLDYPFEVRPLPVDEGGYLITYPDLPGCMADGDTVEEAIADGRDAVLSWIRIAEEFGDPIPVSGSGGGPVRFALCSDYRAHSKRS